MAHYPRNNYPAARLQGLEEDLGLSDSQYQVGLSILFVGYILGQVPSNMLLNYCGKPSWYLGFFTIAWGTVSALTSLVKNYSHIVVCRFFLGIVGKDLLGSIVGYNVDHPEKSRLVIVFYLTLSLADLLTSTIEAPFFPGVIFYLSKWYTKKELAFRTSIFFCGSLISGAFGNLMYATPCFYLTDAH